MCLDIITKRPTPNNKIVKAYKILEYLWDGSICTPYQNSDVKERVWLKAHPVLLQEEQWGNRHGPRADYVSGFHVYKTKKEAVAAHASSCQWSKSRKVVQVEVKQITCEGWDGTSDVPDFRKKYRNLVARFMRYTPPKEKKHGKR